MTDTQVPPVKTDKPPTVDELKANIEASLKALDTPEAPIETPTEEIKVETPVETPVVEEKPEVQPEIKPETPIEPDYKKKFADSTREAQDLHAKNAKIQDAIDAGKALPPPDDSEMTIKYRDWDLMSDVEKMLAREVTLAAKRAELLNKVVEESKNFKVWDDTVDKYVEDPKTLNAFPDLEGKTDEFKLYAAKATRRGSNLETLVGSFLYEQAKNQVKHTGQMFPTGGQASTEKPVVAKKMSLDEARILQQTNYAEFMRKLAAHEIEEIPA